MNTATNAQLKMASLVMEKSPEEMTDAERIQFIREAMAFVSGEGGKDDDAGGLLALKVVEMPSESRIAVMGWRNRIRTAEDAKAHMKKLAAFGLEYHPDDDANEVVNAATGVRVFSDEEAFLLDQRMWEVKHRIDPFAELSAGAQVAYSGDANG